MRNPPLVSVVMPSLNQGRFLRDAIHSVLHQSFPSVELVVADGGSTDGTLQILKDFEVEAGSRLAWTSGPDAGPASAVNKALKRARGEIIGWLNSDDIYAPGAIAAAVDRLTRDSGLVMTYGEGEHIDEAGRPLGRYPTLKPPASIESFQNGCFICQPTVFMRRAAVDAVGFLDEELKTAFDFEYWLRIFRRFPGRIGHIDRLQAYSRLHGGGITRRMRRQVALEGTRVLAKHAGEPRPQWLLTYVEELYARYPFDVSVPDLRAHVAEFLDEAGGPAASAARDALAVDARLQTSLPGVFAAIYPDGWAGTGMDLRIRLDLVNGRRLTIKCSHQWPLFEPLYLRVKPGWDREYRVVVETLGEFELRVELPAARESLDLNLRIESEQCFVPAVVDPGSNDARELSFKLEKLALT